MRIKTTKTLPFLKGRILHEFLHLKITKMFLFHTISQKGYHSSSFRIQFLEINVDSIVIFYRWNWWHFERENLLYTILLQKIYAIYIICSSYFNTFYLKLAIEIKDISQYAFFAQLPRKQGILSKLPTFNIRSWKGHTKFRRRIVQADWSSGPSNFAWNFSLSAWHFWLFT